MSIQVGTLLGNRYEFTGCTTFPPDVLPTDTPLSECFIDSGPPRALLHGKQQGLLVSAQPVSVWSTGET